MTLCGLHSGGGRDGADALEAGTPDVALIGAIGVGGHAIAVVGPDESGHGNHQRFPAASYFHSVFIPVASDFHTAFMAASFGGVEPCGLESTCAPAWGSSGLVDVAAVVAGAWGSALIGGPGTWVETCRAGGGAGNVGETVEATSGWEVPAGTVVGTGLLGRGGMSTTCVGVVGMAFITKGLFGG